MCQFYVNSMAILCQFYVKHGFDIVKKNCRIGREAMAMESYVNDVNVILTLNLLVVHWRSFESYLSAFSLPIFLSLIRLEAIRVLCIRLFFAFLSFCPSFSLIVHLSSH